MAVKMNDRRATPDAQDKTTPIKELHKIYRDKTNGLKLRWDITLIYMSFNNFDTWFTIPWTRCINEYKSKQRKKYMNNHTVYTRTKEMPAHVI